MEAADDIAFSAAFSATFFAAFTTAAEAEEEEAFEPEAAALVCAPDEEDDAERVAVTFAEVSAAVFAEASIFS